MIFTNNSFEEDLPKAASGNLFSTGQKQINVFKSRNCKH